MRTRWRMRIAMASVLMLTAQVAVVAETSVAVAAPAAAARKAVDPVPPPAAVDPTPYITPVTTPGPTEAPKTIAVDTVWGPQGSPYIVRNGGFTLNKGVTLTLLPGAVVKLDTGAAMTFNGQVLSLGTPKARVIFTSLRDDSVLGDTNGDGSATVPARGDWLTLDVSGYPPGSNHTRDNFRTSMFDHTDIRYGGKAILLCSSGYGALNIETPGARLVVTNSRFTHNFMGFRANAVSVTPENAGFTAVYNSFFGEDSYCGLTAINTGGEYLGNTFDDTFGYMAANLNEPNGVRFWYNTVADTVLAHSGTYVPTRAHADVRFNVITGATDDDTVFGNRLNDWSANWFGRDANGALPTCMDPAVAKASVPRIKTEASTTCPTGQEKVVGYHSAVLPALSASPQVLPAAIREAAAPRVGPVNTYSGALTYAVDDLGVEDAGKRLTATRTFRSDRLSTGDAGAGWTTAYTEGLSTTGGVATLNLSDGGSLPFATDAAAGYSRAPGVATGYAPSATGATITTPARDAYRFNASGELVGMTLGDDGHPVTVARSGGQVSRVTGVSGRYLGYTRSGGRLSAVADQSGRGVTLAYSGTRLFSATGVDAQAETYGYDSAGRLTSVVTAEGRTKLAAAYGSDGRVTWVEHEGAGRVTIAYDDTNARRVLTHADGTVVTQQFDWAGRLLTERTGATGRHRIYDGDGHLIADISGVPAAPMTDWAPIAPVTLYDAKGDPVFAADVMGRYTWTTFNDKHQPLSTRRLDNTTVERTYDAAGRLQTVKDPKTKLWAYTHNSRGQVLTQTDPLNRTRAVTYEADGDPASVTDETGATTTFGSDALGRRTLTRDPLTNETRVAYTPWDEVTEVTRPRGGKTVTRFDKDRKPTSVTDPTGVVVAHGYDARGRLESTKDTLGNTTTVAYDAAGRPLTVTDARASVSSRTYNAEGLPDTMKDPTGAVVRYVYDPVGRPMRVTDPQGAVTQTRYLRDGLVTDEWTPDGARWQHAYDIMGNRNQVTTPRNKVWKSTYDVSGAQLTTTDPDSRTTASTYDDLGRILSRTDEEAVRTEYAYNDVQRTVTVTDALGTRSVRRLNAAGQPLSNTDGSGRVTSFGYDADGNQTGVTDAAGTATAEYDLAGRVGTETDPTGRATVAEYDTVGRVKKLTRPGGAFETYTYDANGNVDTRVDTRGKAWKYTYDKANRVKTETDPLGSVTAHEYNGLGLRTKTTDATGVVRNTAYDPVGREAVNWDVDGNSHVTRYDLDGNLAQEQDPTGVLWWYESDVRGLPTRVAWGPASNTIEYLATYGYDKVGRLTERREPYAFTRRNTYDIRGRLKTATDTRNNVTSYEYDGEGRRTLETLPSGRTTAWTYDGAGRLDTVKDGAQAVTDHDHDAAGRPTKTTLPRGGVYAYDYDAAGRMRTETTPAQEVTTFGYDEAGHTTSVRYHSGRTVTATYDAAGRPDTSTAGGVVRDFDHDDAGRLTTASVGGRTVSHTYDNRGLLTGSTDALGTTTYGYDPAYRLTYRAPPSGVATRFTYDAGRGVLATVRGATNLNVRVNAANQITELTAVAPSGGGSELFSYNSSNGLLSWMQTNATQIDTTFNVDGQVESLTHRNAGKTTYTYDSAGRLKTGTHVLNNVTTATTYGWDADSNRTSVQVGSQPAVTSSYDLADRLTGSSDGTTYSYTDGLLTGTNTGTGYTYDGFGELATATTPAGTAAYTHDALGRVDTRVAGGATQRYSYEGTSDDVSGSDRVGGAYTQVVRAGDGMLLAEATTGGATVRPRSTPHGDVSRFVNDTTGAATWTASYDPFGAATTTGTAPPVPMGFQSMPTDPLTGLVDMGARPYQPTTGRFTAPDTVIGALDSPISLNRYLYGNGDPLSMFDPDGHWPQWLSNLTSGIGDLFQTIGNLAGSAWSGIQSAASGAGRAFASAGPALRSVAADFAANTAKFWEEHQDRIVSTLAGVAVGAAIVGGCALAGVATAGLAAAACAGAAIGAVMGGAFCDLGNRSPVHCVATGAVSGAVGGYAGGMILAGGGGAALSGAFSGFYGDATEQLLSTGRIDSQRLAMATAGGAALGWLGGKLGAQAAKVSGRGANLLPKGSPRLLRSAGVRRGPDGQRLKSNQIVVGLDRQRIVTMPSRTRAMDEGYARGIAAKYGVDLDGLTLNLDRDSRAGFGEVLPNQPVRGQWTEITLYPPSFWSEEELVRTLVHESYHIRQLRQGMGHPKRGGTYSSYRDYENPAWAYEDWWWNNNGFYDK